IYRCLRGRRRNRGYSHETCSHDRGHGNGSGGLSDIQGHGSFFCGGEGTVTYNPGASSYQPMPRSPTYSISGRCRGGGEGSVVITSGDNRDTSGWGTVEGSVSVYSSNSERGYNTEDSGPNVIGSSGSGGESSYHGGNSGITAGGYGHEDPATSGGSGGSGYYSGGVGYGYRGYSGPEFSSGGGGSSQATQQKCPVVIPDIKAHQSKKTSHWPPSEKK
ncbi:PREDICTED: loricrin-like, partial [Buceros rhinoceros silvestris]|uniref:loricrin-like n=1 Tax=Buceros rhinoceros silvestris TaxID=175836 RepID=UPI00052921C8